MAVHLYFSCLDRKSIDSGFYARWVLSRILKVEGKNLNFTENYWGKPRLMDFPSVHFNISHTDDAIVCAVYRNTVGVDMEKERKIRPGLVRQFFTSKENEYIFSDCNQTDVRFTRIWTMKEAYLKWTGRGMSIPLNSFNVLNMDNVLSFIHNRYHIALCSNGLCRDPDPIHVRLTDLTDAFSALQRHDGQ
jgi:4'-phosphopantetheinyl transferase